MAKMMVGDRVAVVKPHDVTGTPHIVMMGVLDALDRGLKTTDRRAKAQEGPCTPENAVEATGWAVVRVDGQDSPFSVSLKNVKLLTQAVTQQHEDTLKSVESHLAKRKEQEAEVEGLKTLCAAAGFDVSTLTEANLRVAAGLLKGSSKVETTSPQASASTAASL